MADWNSPQITTNYTQVLTDFKEQREDLAKMFDRSTSTNIPLDTIRWSSDASRFEKFDGTNWNQLDTLYEMKVADSNKLGGQLPTYYATANHGHGIGDVTGLQTALEGLQPAGEYNPTIGTNADINTSGAEIIDNISVTNGVITSMEKRNLVARDIGALSTNGTAANSTLLNGKAYDYYFKNTGGSNVDPNTTLDPCILTNHGNSPSASYYWHIQTQFYSSVGGNCAQLAIQYNGGNQVYARSKYGSTWTAWVRCDNNGIAGFSGSYNDLTNKPTILNGLTTTVVTQSKTASSLTTLSFDISAPSGYVISGFYIPGVVNYLTGTRVKSSGTFPSGTYTAYVQCIKQS